MMEITLSRALHNPPARMHNARNMPCTRRVHSDAVFARPRSLGRGRVRHCWVPVLRPALRASAAAGVR